MNSIATTSPFLSLGVVIRALREAVAAWGGRGVLGSALVWLVHRRLGEILGRMERMAARFQAGRLRAGGARARVARVSDEGRVPVAEQRVRGARIWPSEFGWLVRMATWQAAGFGLQLRAVLEHPEMVAFLAAAPQARRVLRPVCRMLAIEPTVLGEVVAVRVKRVRAVPVPVDTGRVPVPPGAMAWVRRDRFSKN